MTKLANGTGGPSDSQGGTVAAYVYLEGEVRTGVTQIQGWRFSYQLPEFDTAPSYEPQWIFDGDNVYNSASFALNGSEMTPEFMGEHSSLLGTYVQNFEHVNVEISDDRPIHVDVNPYFGDHDPFSNTYVQNFEHVNVENSIINLDVFEYGKPKPRYTWTTGAF